MISADLISHAEFSHQPDVLRPPSPNISGGSSVFILFGARPSRSVVCHPKALRPPTHHILAALSDCLVRLPKSRKVDRVSVPSLYISMHSSISWCFERFRACVTSHHTHTHSSHPCVMVGGEAYPISTYPSVLCAGPRYRYLHTP